jgi:hypothetical protein
LPGRPRSGGAFAKRYFVVMVVSALLGALMHRSAWKVNSPKLVCRMVHIPARWPPYGRPETSRPLKVDHCMLHGRWRLGLVRGNPPGCR